ncbi:hypothetical protein VP01_8184g1 [Puccinia sorghi]|uniref:Helicase ATP-binding domain-containing protein n=1 Tax=Puccinia sorghi TaxID=27349 RepID=A0A0L6UAW4_9BASI|nr:hypothetical protein VP01_8184g1 [Puccinia sorghi]
MLRVSLAPPMLDKAKAPSTPSTAIPPQQRVNLQPPNLEPDDSETAPCQGSILADDMGLGKTLTTLMFVLGTSHLARGYQQSNLINTPVQCAATLIICPPETYFVFHGRGCRGITREERYSFLVVLNTYKMIVPSGNPQHTNKFTIEKHSIIRNPNAKKMAHLQKIHMLCLSGTPFQNWLADVQSLISLLSRWPWNQDWIYLIPGMNVGKHHGVQTVNRMMEIVKQAILNLPKKIEKDFFFDGRELGTLLQGPPQ